jgi:hypothetical protein
VIPSGMEFAVQRNAQRLDNYRQHGGRMSAESTFLFGAMVLSGACQTNSACNDDTGSQQL